MAEPNPKKRKANIVGAVQRLFNLENPDARYVLAKLIKEANVFTPTFVKGDPYESAFNEGQRRIVCSLFKHLTTDLNQLVESIRALENETES